MRKVRRWLCRHDYETRSVYIRREKLVERCRKCGKQVTRPADERASPA